LKILVAIFLLTIAAEPVFGQKTSGIPERSNQKQLVRFFPNPASSYINFEFKTEVARGSSFQVFNFLGRRVLNTSLSGSRITLNLTDYMRGVYIFQVLDNQGRIVETNKFQVSK
jgi:hypothetical protein